MNKNLIILIKQQLIPLQYYVIGRYRDGKRNRK